VIPYLGDIFCVIFLVPCEDYNSKQFQHTRDVKDAIVLSFMTQNAEIL
jgi:hypothetical protein